MNLSVDDEEPSVIEMESLSKWMDEVKVIARGTMLDIYKSVDKKYC